MCLIDICFFIVHYTVIFGVQRVSYVLLEITKCSLFSCCVSHMCFFISYNAAHFRAACLIKICLYYSIMRPFIRAACLIKISFLYSTMQPFFLLRVSYVLLDITLCILFWCCVSHMCLFIFNISVPFFRAACLICAS